MLSPINSMKTKFLLSLIGAAICSAVCTAGAATEPTQTGRVYVLSNKPKNSVLVFNRASDGSLTLLQEAVTQGVGTGATNDPLQSQGSLALSKDGKVLLAVNPASGELTAFRVTNGGLEFGSKVLSGGFFPVSVTIDGKLVYVVNQLGFPNISGYTVDDNGQLLEIAGSQRDLAGGPLALPAQVSFTPDASQLIVTEKGTRLLDTFNVLPNGQTDGPLTELSRGKTPFGFAFGPGKSVIISEAEGGLPLRATTSSYQLTGDDVPQPVSPRVHDNGTAACWVAVTGDVAWVVNTASTTISAYHIDPDASITLIDPAAATIPDTVPIDVAATPDGRFLYQVLSTTGQIAIFAINGSALTPLSTVEGLPLSIQGIVAR
jgi:6-phosphogluconolactonase (cycloisomerase 2 family)